ncbi:hypothetical protein OBBRIDRAFT_848034 [Obba rivulosa]|uniref:RRM domain-containing protein n=1 Tax=Obba rivulosa TaxID=1052685 RepID=A0A8E2J4N0_9APHY|nr:hypothetical protein OBBRIDRAFT_848034 [Obba rivulosa]
MASSIAARRPPPAFTPSASTHPSDEAFINRSLLDSLDAQADAEPVSSSSDSEPTGAAVAAFSSFSAASSISPSVPYHISMHAQQPPRPDSPNDNILSSHLHSAPHNADSFNPGSQNVNTTHSVYNSMNSIHLATSEFAPLASQEHDALNFQPNVNGFSSAPYRTSTSFNPFPARSRHTNPSFRDSSSNFGASAYPSPSTDLYGAVPTSLSHLQSPTQQSATFAFESMQHSGRAHDFASGPQSPGVGGVSQGKPLPFGNMDPFRQGLDSSLLQTHQVCLQQQFQAPYVNGMSHALGHAHPGPFQNQTQFGSTLPTNGTGSGPGAGQGSSLVGASGMSHNSGAQSSQQQEEISTIFVVGFPEDMSEREFQNMFTFSSGFEAATLKIPNKEYTAYGSGAPTGPRSGFQYPGSNDPYNIVTVNQGGVVVDGGRDGPTTSWPTVPPQGNDDGHFVQSNVPQAPRKQIIGFAKFRTRQEALEARDVLQGRRVDVERGSTLKAEMAKKNLHTKRGPGGGPLGIPSGVGGAAGSLQPDTLVTIPGLNSLAGLGAGGGSEPLSQRDKDIGILGAMGIGLGQRRERQVDTRDDEDRERHRAELATVGAMGLGSLGTRGPRERAEEDERERKRKEKEAARLRQNSFAFEAFHSVPQQMVRQGANSLLSAESGVTLNGLGLSSPPTQPESLLNGSSQSPWGNLRDVSASAALRKMSMPVLSTPSAIAIGARPTSPQQTSPGTLEVIASTSGPLSASSNGNGSAISGNRSAPFSPQSNTSSLPGHPSLPTRPRPFSPGLESPAQPGSGQNCVMSSLPASSASSPSGSQSGHEEDLARPMAGLTVNTSQGNTSPQLPSPASGASSGSVTTGRNPGDQNPPASISPLLSGSINTLYVGNLPTSTLSGAFPFNFLEDRLRELFSKQPGYRKLCFRQKSNGPMCFVEFEDVSYATRALNELYGHTLNGLVKGGGIRLSYSKNPLGVRTPTNGGSNLSQQQQQQAAAGLSFISDAFQSRQGDLEGSRFARRDTSGMTSPTSSYHYTTSPPPPRFVSPPPASTPFGPTLAGAATFPRTNPQGFGLAPGGTSTFSPFGISPSHSTIPDQPSADVSNEHINRMSPRSANIEASRAG